MDWRRDGADWPNREVSRFLDVAPHRWHVQVMGRGPDLLLIHGAGGATQSWRHLLPELARDFRVIAPDLPGQGFSTAGARARLGMAPMSDDLGRLAAAGGWAPRLIVGHSAGGALALETVRRGVFDPAGVVGINAALGTFDGLAGWLFPLMARVMALNPLVPPLLARMAGGRNRAAELLASTGSAVDDEGIALYHRLMTDRRHIDGTLAMMAAWRIEPLLERLEEIRVPTLLIAGRKDGTVPFAVSERAAARLPAGRAEVLDGLGHLAHEEAPDRIAGLIRARAGALSLEDAEGARPA